MFFNNLLFFVRFSPLLNQRRPSADSEASFYTARQQRTGPEYPLDPVRLLARVIDKEDPQHMAKGELYPLFCEIVSVKIFGGIVLL